jgi:hypothetical protein
MDCITSGDRSAGHKFVLMQFDKQWLGMGLAAAGALAATESVDAAIQYFAPVGGIAVPVSAAGVYIDVETGANTTTGTGFLSATRPVINFWGTTAFRAYFYPNPTTENRYVVSGSDLAALNTGDPIGPGSTYAAGRNLFTTSPANTTWNSTAGFNGLLGFKFRNNANTNTFYGWMRVQTNPWTGGSTYAGGAVLEWAYDDTGLPVAAGVVPEPTSLALLAAGAAGLLARRRCA